MQALERIVESRESLGRKRLLCECIQAYAPLELDDFRLDFRRSEFVRKFQAERDQYLLRRKMHG